jgi:hypothetical protein
MSVETIGEAYDASWRVNVRCAWGPRDGMKRICARSCGRAVGDAGEPVEVSALWIAAGASGVQRSGPGSGGRINSIRFPPFYVRHQSALGVSVSS